MRHYRYLPGSIESTLKAEILDIGFTEQGDGGSDEDDFVNYEDASFSRRISGLSVRNSTPRPLTGGCLIKETVWKLPKKRWS
jgi:hypothetical protein